MVRRISLLTLAACLLSTGCSLLPSRVLPVTPFPLAPLVAADVPPSATQTLEAAFGNTEIALQCAFASEGGGWRSVCIGPGGRRVMTVNVDANQNVTAQVDPAVPAAFDPRRMVADIQLAFWPLQALVEATRDTPWRVTQPNPATRRLSRGARLIAEVHYADANPWNGRLWISNYALGYSIFLVTEAAAVREATR